MTSVCKGPIATVCLSPHAGGMEHVAMSIARNMAELATHSVLIVRDGTWLARKAEAQGLNVEPVAMAGNINPWAAIRLRRLWWRHDIRNLVYLGSSEMPTLFLSLLGLDMNFLVRHGTTKRRSKQDIFHRMTWSKVTTYWCISEHIRVNVASVFPTAGKTSFVAYTSQSHKLPDIPLARASRSTYQPLALVHIGRLQQDKGQRDAIRITSALNKSGLTTELTLYGEGPDRECLGSMVNDLGLSERVHFAGETNRPFQHLDKFHAFVFPSAGEGLPNAFLEAAASGMPCFAYENTAFPELSRVGLHFDMLPNGDVDAMAECIRQRFRYSAPSLNYANVRLLHKIFSMQAERQTLCHYLV